MKTTTGLLLCASLMALLPCCLANIKDLIVNDFSETPENASFAVRLILGQPKKPNLRSTVRMRSNIDNTFPDLVVIFEKINVPSYGDFCPNVIVSLGQDTDPPESFLDIQGSCLSDDLDKEWYKKDANQVTLQIQDLSPATKTQKGSLQLLLLTALVPREGASCPEGTQHCRTLLGDLKQLVCLHADLNDTALEGHCVLLSNQSFPQDASSTSSSATTELNVVHLSLCGVILAVLLCLGILAIVLLRRHRSKSRRGYSPKATKGAVAPASEKSNGGQTQSSPSKGKWGLPSGSEEMPTQEGSHVSSGQSNGGPAAPPTATNSENVPFLDKQLHSQPMSSTRYPSSHTNSSPVRLPSLGLPQKSGGERGEISSRKPAEAALFRHDPTHGFPQASDRTQTTPYSRTIVDSSTGLPRSLLV